MFSVNGCHDFLWLCCFLCLLLVGLWGKISALSITQRILFQEIYEVYVKFTTCTCKIRFIYIRMLLVYSEYVYTNLCLRLSAQCAGNYILLLASCAILLYWLIVCHAEFAMTNGFRITLCADTHLTCYTHPKSLYKRKIRRGIVGHYIH